MQYRQRVLEQVLHSQPQPIEVALGRGRQIGAALRSVGAESQPFVAEPCREAGCASIHEVQASDVDNNLW